MQVAFYYSTKNYPAKSKNASLQYTSDANSINSSALAKFHTITFKGRNPKQVLLLCSECFPYTTSGGLGSTTREMTRVFKRIYGKSKDLRINIPLYNAGENGPKMHNNKPVLEIFDSKDELTKQPKRFELEEIIKDIPYKFGVRKSKASLYKIKKPENGVPTYVTYSPAFSFHKKEYPTNPIDLYSTYIAFNAATLELLKKFPSAEAEKFNPGILHTKDWHTSYTSYFMQEETDTKNSFKDMKNIHEFSNVFVTSQGKIKPFFAALNVFSENQINKLKNNNQFKKEIANLIYYNKNTFFDAKTGIFKPGTDVNKAVNDNKNMDNILGFVGNNFEKVMNPKHNFYIVENLNKIIRKEFKEIYWDDVEDFNPTVLATNSCDAWYTMSKTHFNELLTDPSHSTHALWNSMRANVDKGLGIRACIDTAQYNPKSKFQIKFPFDINDFKEGKLKNKLFLYEQFSQENIEKGTFSNKVINSTKPPFLKGFLTPSAPDVPLITSVFRFDVSQKGSDILLESVKEVLDKHDARFIIGQPGITKLTPDSNGIDVVNKFMTEVMDNPKYRGKVVVIDSYLPINQYLAGADISLIPSRSETCGLVAYQSARYGAVPVITPVGGGNDVMITPDKNIKKAMAFKTPVNLINSDNPSEIYAHTIEEAIDSYKNQETLFENMVKNCMQYNSDWNESVKSYSQLYSRVAQSKRVNTSKEVQNLIKKPATEIKMLHREDIKKVKPADAVVIIAHPDDEIFFTGIIDFIKKGHKVQIVYTADGSLGHRRDGAPATGKALSLHREKEALNALGEMGIKQNPINLGFPDNEINAGNNPEQISKMVDSILALTKPKYVFSFGPEGYTGNVDHITTGEIAFDSVQKYNRCSDPAKEIKLYQAALSQKNYSDFKTSMTKCETDTWEYMKPVSDNDISLKINVSGYTPQILKSATCHISQWFPEELKGFEKFFESGISEFTSLKKFPRQQNLVSPWGKEAMEFKVKYGEEFTRYSNNEIVFRPKNSEGAFENYEFNLYTSDFGEDKTSLWLESSLFSNVDICPSAPAAIFKNIHKIMVIPEFEKISAVQMAIPSKDYSKINIIKVPISESEDFAKHAKEICTDFDTGIEKYKKENPNSSITHETIQEFMKAPGDGIAYRPLNDEGELEDYTLNLYLSDFGQNTENLWLESSFINDVKNHPTAPAAVFKNIQKIMELPKFKDLKYINFSIQPANKTEKQVLVVPVFESKNFAKYATEICTDFDTGIEKYKKENPDSKMKIK